MKKCPAEVAENSISEPINLKKMFLEEHAPLRRSNLSFPAYTFKTSSYAPGNV